MLLPILEAGEVCGCVFDGIQRGCPVAVNITAFACLWVCMVRNTAVYFCVGVSASASASAST